MWCQSLINRFVSRKKFCLGITILFRIFSIFLLVFMGFFCAFVFFDVFRDFRRRFFAYFHFFYYFRVLIACFFFVSNNNFPIASLFLYLVFEFLFVLSIMETFDTKYFWRFLYIICICRLCFVFTPQFNDYVLCFFCMQRICCNVLILLFDILLIYLCLCNARILFRFWIIFLYGHIFGKWNIEWFCIFWKQFAFFVFFQWKFQKLNDLFVPLWQFSCIITIRSFQIS